MEETQIHQKETEGCLKATVRMQLDETTEIWVPIERWKEVVTRLARKRDNEQSNR